MPGLEEELKKKINRPVSDLPLSDDTDTITLASTRSLTNGNGNSHAKSTSTGFVNQLDAPTCPSCGHVAVRNGACYKCLNCGESLGCS
ncbi:MAG: hypothetical protein ABIR24_07665, partial [Verrucomicrobiota bacterium]